MSPKHLDAIEIAKSIPECVQLRWNALDDYPYFILDVSYEDSVPLTRKRLDILEKMDKWTQRGLWSWDVKARMITADRPIVWERPGTTKQSSMGQAVEIGQSIPECVEVRRHEKPGGDIPWFVIDCEGASERRVRKILTKLKNAFGSNYKGWMWDEATDTNPVGKKLILWQRYPEETAQPIPDKPKKKDCYRAYRDEQGPSAVEGVKGIGISAEKPTLTLYVEDYYGD